MNIYRGGSNGDPFFEQFKPRTYDEVWYKLNGFCIDHDNYKQHLQCLYRFYKLCKAEVIANERLFKERKLAILDNKMALCHKYYNEGYKEGIQDCILGDKEKNFFRYYTDATMLAGYKLFDELKDLVPKTRMDFNIEALTDNSSKDKWKQLHEDNPNLVKEFNESQQKKELARENKKLQQYKDGSNVFFR